MNAAPGAPSFGTTALNQGRSAPAAPQAELLFTRRFSMGHRLIAGTSDRCAIPHGHNEHVTVSLAAGLGHPSWDGAGGSGRLDGHANMLLPFAEAKGRWHRFIDERMDHSFQIGRDDPLLDWFRTHEPSRLGRLVVTPGDPTTELLAALLMAKMNAFLHAQGDVLRLTALEIRETPTNAVRLVGGDPSAYLPVCPAVEGEGPLPWWHRADDSTA
ncbi:6-carboxytetrahydropterin synthase [Formicincola oecophyllae]|uniref:6-carboxy-5,6,7,8-tetrahydropterin synthase n=1 Tax=Formicincola oecophyllae TaxID=2558361 RepID=A0A4Y6UAH5_9PROT|nr:6-carboxytetrahydropterin synthase [Formicincola oecophyllae]QDH13381.1 6-carboxytetrahydropterin synthase [Formicincola oecophyllae]